MKNFRNRLAGRAARAGLQLAAGGAGAALALSAVATVMPGQEKPVVSARPGQRTFQELPPAAKGGIPLSLSQSIALALSDNKDLDITINFAESSRFALFQTHGI